MKTFKEKLLALVDNTANQARDLIGGFSTMVDEIDWDTHFNAATEFMRERKESLTAKANDLLKEFSDLVKQVKDNLTDFAVTVAFDESIGEKLEYNVDAESNTLNIEVSYKDDVTTRSYKTSVKIPQNCDVTRISKMVNALNKTATITIPKVLIEPTEEKIETPTEEVKPKTYKVRKAKKSKAKVASPTNNEEEKATEHISSKLAERLKQNVERAKLRRDASGRFVRREV